MRALAVRSCVLAIALSLLGGCGQDPPRVERPARHVLLVVVDTLRADRLGAFGCPRGTSTAIDALAARGVRFTNTIAQSSWTAPSMVSLMSGRHLAERRMSVPADVATLAERFQAAGFATAAFVTNPLISPTNGFDRGFDRFERAQHFRGDPRIEDWLRARGETPSFTYVHLTEPHDPYTPPGRTVRPTRVPASESTRAAWEAETAARGLTDLEDAAERIEREIARYEGEVRQVDRQVFAYVRALEQAGQLEHSAVAIASDHGEGLWQHVDARPFVRVRLEKGEPDDVSTLFQQRHGCQLHQELIHVPLVLVAPSLPRGVTVDRLVENVDLAPTLLELAGLAPPRGVQGQSLVGLALGEDEQTRGAAFSITRFARAVVRADGWKLVEPTDFGRTAALDPALYHLPTDPEERVDRLPEEPELARELAALIDAWAATGLRAADEESQAAEERNLEALRALGYVDDAGGGLDPEPVDDPRDE